MALADDTKALVHEASFKPILHLFLDNFINAILVQALVERWWDTTHTFHIAERKMNLTPYAFRWMTNLQCDSLIINLEGESGIVISIELLEWSCIAKSVRYFDLEMDHRPFPQKTLKDCAQMVRAFLLYILGAYLFANGGETMSLKWLVLFRDFSEAWEAN